MCFSNMIFKYFWVEYKIIFLIVSMSGKNVVISIYFKQKDWDSWAHKPT